jgi:predicted N-acetyltransferase YhbS
LITLEQLIRQEFGVPFERCAYEFTTDDEQGCVAHVGLDRRQIKPDVLSVTWDVAAIRFVVTRPDKRHTGAATDLMIRAHGAAVTRLGCEFAVLFSGVTGFYERLGYRTVRSGAMVCELIDGYEWPGGEWNTVGPEW